MGKNKIKKIMYITGTRADYGLMRTVLKEIDKNPKLSLDVVATGMHVMKRFGYTLNEIKKDKFRVHVINTKYERDDKESMTSFIGRLISKLTEKVKKIKPDLILVLGDRAEMLAGAIVGSYLTIPVAHVQGGDVTSTVDDIARHAITKLSHIHFPATKTSAERIKRLGEEIWRIHISGTPGLDEIMHSKFLKKDTLFKNLGLNPKKKTAIILQHPVTEEISKAAIQMKTVIDAVKDTGLQALIVYPNSDPGGREMIKVIESYRNNKNFIIFKSIEHKIFLNLMKHADLMVGNSSSGLLEAPSFRLPAVNIGIRQEGRERAKNVIDVPNRKKEISAGIKKAISPNFKKKIADTKNPYGKGVAGKIIASTLADIKLDDRLKQKKIVY